MKTSVLIVDDSADSRSYCKLIFQMYNLKVRSAKSVKDALALIQDGFRPDIVLLDLMMPGLRPEKLVNHIKGDPNLIKTKVAIMSSLRDVKSIAANLGADFAMHKPLMLSQFSDLLDLGSFRELPRSAAGIHRMRNAHTV